MSHDFTQKKSILILSFSVLKSDPRVLRQVRELKNSYILTVAGYGSIGIPVDYEIIIEHRERKLLKKMTDGLLMTLGLNYVYYWYLNTDVIQFNKVRTTQKYDLIIANDFDTLPLALGLQKSNPVFLDAHEYTPDEIPRRSVHYFPLRIYKKWLVRRHITKVVRMSTVSNAIGSLYSTTYKIPIPLFIPNAPRYSNIKPQINNNNKIKLVYHGGVGKERGIELLIDSVCELQNKYELHLILTGNNSRIEKIKRSTKYSKSIFFHLPVNTEQIPRFLNQFDIGIFLAQDVSKSEYLCLPNKFFEFIQARLGVIVGTSPEMASYVKKYEIGRVVKGFTKKDLVQELMTLNHASVSRFKMASHHASRELCWETFAPDFRRAIEKYSK